MSDFKFSCPACGQHLAGDLVYAGRQITCPTCHQAFTVPSPESAVATTEPAPAAPPPPPPLPALPRAASAKAAIAPPPPGKGQANSKTSSLAVASLMCLLLGPIGAIAAVICGHLARRQINRDPSLRGRGLATAGLIIGYGLLGASILAASLLVVSLTKRFKEALRTPPQPAVELLEPGAPTTPPVAAVGAPAADAAGWTLQLDGVVIPSEAAQGRLHGRAFKPDQVVLQGNWLKFRQGREFFADLELSVVLFEDDLTKLANRTFTVPGDPGVQAHVWLHWKEPGKALPQSQSFVDQDALRLEFGAMRGGKLPGKIYVCVPDDSRSFLRGSFEAEVKPAVSAPKTRPPRSRSPSTQPIKRKAGEDRA